MGIGVFPRSLSFYAVLFACLAVSAHAREDIVPGSRYTSAEGAAVGDAFLPLGTDAASGLFYNPAALGRIRDLEFEPVNLGLYGNAGYLGNANNQMYNATSLSSYKSYLLAHPSTFSGMGFSVVPTFSYKGFAFGLLYQTQIAGEGLPNGNLRYRSLYQLIPTVGYGLRLAEGIVRIGYSLQWVSQASGDLTVPGTRAPLGYNQNLAEGAALSHNLGFALTFPFIYLPSFNLVIRNAGGASYSKTALSSLSQNSSGTPATEPMTVDGSISWQYKLGGGNQFHFVVEDRDATNRSSMPILGRVALGTELNFRDFVSIRGGFGSGYPSAGIGFKRKMSQFALTWYSEEVGQAYHGTRDIRYLLQYTLRVF